MTTLSIRSLLAAMFFTLPLCAPYDQDSFSVSEHLTLSISLSPNPNLSSSSYVSHTPSHSLPRQTPWVYLHHGKLDSRIKILTALLKTVTPSCQRCFCQEAAPIHSFITLYLPHITSHQIQLSFLTFSVITFPHSYLCGHWDLKPTVPKQPPGCSLCCHGRLLKTPLPSNNPISTKSEHCS